MLLTAQRVVIAYKDVGNSNYGTIIAGTVSGTALVLVLLLYLNPTSNYNQQHMTLLINKVVIAYEDDNGNSQW